jgi:hypothetical protein
MNADTQKAILAATGRFIRKMLDPVEDRLKALEGRIIEKGDPGDPGKDGRDGNDGKDGVNGLDGKSVTLEEVTPILEEAITKGLEETKLLSAELVQRAIESIPVPENGKDGTDGQDGKDGQDGQSLSVKDIEEQVELSISKALLSFERRAYDVLHRSIEVMPKPKDGINGKDGFGFDDLNIEHDGRRSFSFTFQQGDRIKSFNFVLPLVLDAGFYQEGKSYEAGDGTTFGGSYWIAKEATSEKPGAGSESWRLAVKKGRDGKVS